MATPILSPLPHPGRATVFNALFNFIVNTPPPVGSDWKTTSQWLRHWNDVAPEQQPALFLHRWPQVSEQKHAFGVTKWAWKAAIIVYYRTDGYRSATAYPDQLTDRFLDDLEQTFQTVPLLTRQTLGGLVWNVWLDGNVYSDPGLLDGQSVIVAPLTILL